VTSGWERRPLKYFLSSNVGGVWGEDSNGTADDSVVLRSTDISLGGGWSIDEPAIRAIPAGERARKLLRTGDLVVVKSSGSAQHLGKTALVTCDVAAMRPCFANFVQRLRPSSSGDPRYLWYFLNSDFAVSHLAALGTTTTGLRNLSGAILGAIECPGPPLGVQRAIADFLDNETARVDTLLATERSRLALLNERFESAVFFAVTQGIRNEPLKATDLGWVEQIPQTWGTPTVSLNFELQLGKMLSAEAAQGPEPHPYVRNVNVHWDRFELDDLATMHFGAEDRRRCELRSGDVLVCEGGEVGRAAVWPGNPINCYFQKAIHRARPRAGANSRFLMYCLRAAAKRDVFAIEGNTSTIVHLTGEQLKMYRFPWPPIHEQADIVNHLDAACAWTNAARSVLMRQIELIQERRQALITAAVTGQFSLPGVSAA
jgi:type I restriction enzyme S subunit